MPTCNMCDVLNDAILSRITSMAQVDHRGCGRETESDSYTLVYQLLSFILSCYVQVIYSLYLCLGRCGPDKDRLFKNGRKGRVLTFYSRLGRGRRSRQDIEGCVLVHLTGPYFSGFRVCSKGADLARPALRHAGGVPGGV